MNLIECTLGAVSQHVNGTTYSFQRDKHGRYVADVQNLLDRSLFLSVSHYREVPAVVEEPKPKRARSAAPVAAQDGSPASAPPAASGEAGEDEEGGEGEGEADTGEESGEGVPEGGAPQDPPADSGSAQFPATADKPKSRGGRRPKAKPEA